MISDTLFEAQQEIERYLYSPDMRDAYQGNIRARIVQLLVNIDAIRADLDNPFFDDKSAQTSTIF